MREIKFRYWNGNEKKMYYKDIWDKFPLSGVDEFFLEFTGLKDKNGTPIYEGDVVVCKTTYGKDEKEVVWDDKRAGFYLKSDFVAYDPKNLFLMSGKKMEVIGNIYENSELLEPKKND